MNKKGRYIVQRIRNYSHFGEEETSYDVQFEDKEGFEHIAEFVFRSDAVKFKKLKNNELLEKGLYRFNDIKG